MKDAENFFGGRRVCGPGSIKKMIPWEQYGYELVGEAPDGEVALPMIRKLKPDLLITDIKMPFMDGLTLSKMVRKDFPGMKIVILSGYDDFNYAKQAIGIGVEDYLLKPITKNAFSGKTYRDQKSVGTGKGAKGIL